MSRILLSLTAFPDLQLQMAHRTRLPWRGSAAAGGALFLTLVLSRIGMPLPRLHDVPILAALILIGCAGILAWHFARLTVLPRAVPGLAALIAAILPVLALPHPGEGALLVPAAVALWLAVRRPDQRVVALMVQCGALAAALPSSGGGIWTSFVSATMLGIALILALRDLSGGANDNPLMKRTGHNSKLPQIACYASADSIPGEL